MIIIVELLFIVLLAMILFMTYMDDHVDAKKLQASAKVEEYWGADNRRKHMRFKKNLEVNYILEKKAHLKNNGKTVDISEGGMKLLLNEKLHKGAIVDLKIAVPDSKEPAEVEGEVAWSEDAAEKGEGDKRLFYSGIKFVAIKEPAGTHLIDYIRSLTLSSSNV